MHSMGSVYKLAVTVSANSAEAQQWYQKAFPLMKKLAEQGDADAQYYLGKQYFHADGIAENRKEAARWYSAAAEQGHAEAQKALATAYKYGTLYPKDLKESIRRLEMAARQGFPDAQADLAYEYDSSNNNMLSIEDPRSLFWHQRAAEQGLVLSIGVLQDHYKWRDPEMAAYWEEKRQAYRGKYWIESRGIV